MLYSCTHMATVGVKGLIVTHLHTCVSGWCCQQLALTRACSSVAAVCCIIVCSLILATIRSDLFRPVTAVNL